MSLPLSCLVGPSNTHTTFSATSQTCVLNGNDDIYGIELRLGLYLQWAFLIVATWIAPEAARYARSIANIITIALLADALKPPQVGSVIVLQWWIHGFDTFFL
ncbi:hypothetical protein EG327_002445 [Venturia inaequalis]|uniref:Uncharacterized protein n=1 Tax=Venturia inaequalis TaxID=5025 RepID=A0A8H3VMQ0_VENIN|nr:hypothetical protein EG327_002445 [Venturia inaequalis]